MADNAVVRARIDEATKSEAAAVLAAMGLSLSDAFRMLLKRAAIDRRLREEAVTVYDTMQADPSRGVPADQVAVALRAHHADRLKRGRRGTSSVVFRALANPRPDGVPIAP